MSTISPWLGNFTSHGQGNTSYKPHCCGCTQFTASTKLLDPTSLSRLMPLPYERQLAPRFIQEGPQFNPMSDSHFSVLPQPLFSLSLPYLICHMAVFLLTPSPCYLLWFFFWFHFVFLLIVIRKIFTSYCII